jgi:glycine cleavage system H protein
MVPDNLVYTAEHEYLAPSNDPAVSRIGITDYAQGELGDVVFVTLPRLGEHFEAHQTFGTIEAVKAVSELYTPLAGTITEINAALETDPALVNRDPYGSGWMVAMRFDDPAGRKTLLSPAAYRAHIGE